MDLLLPCFRGCVLGFCADDEVDGVVVVVVVVEVVEEAGFLVVTCFRAIAIYMCVLWFYEKTCWLFENS